MDSSDYTPRVIETQRIKPEIINISADDGSQQIVDNSNETINDESDNLSEENAKKIAKAVFDKYDAFFATQLTLIAKEKGVSVEELLCLRHNDITANFQKTGRDIKFWVEVK